MAEDKPTKRNWRFKDLTGQIFGRLTVIQYSHTTHVKRTMWECRCECGETAFVDVSNLIRGKQVSCGCYKRESTYKYTSTHRMSDTPEHDSWQHAKDRCFNPNNKSFENYGGRGITMCDEWVHSFESFFADMGPRPDGTSLDRIDNNGPYAKGNCRWATILEQNNNRRPRRWKVRPD